MEKDGEYYFKRAWENFLNKDIQVGWGDLDRAISIDPGNVTYYQYRGTLRYNAQEWLLASADFSKIIDLSTNLDDLRDAYSKRADCYEALGNYTELILDMDWLINNGFGRAAMHRWRGHHHYLAGKFEEALKDFSIAYEKEPTNDSLLRRAQVYYQLKKYENALQDLTHIIESQEHNPNYLAAIYRWRGSTYYRLGDDDRALEDFNQEMRLTGHNPFSNLTSYLEAFNAI